MAGYCAGGCNASIALSLSLFALHAACDRSAKSIRVSTVTAPAPSVAQSSGLVRSVGKRTYTGTFTSTVTVLVGVVSQPDNKLRGHNSSADSSGFGIVCIDATPVALGLGQVGF